VESEEADVARQRLSKHVPAVTNTHAAIEEMWDAVFSVGPCRIKYSVRTEIKVGNQFFPELLLIIVITVITTTIIINI
jgi:hypothetical protein